MSELGKPAYQGRPDPQHIADRFMLIIFILLILGFIQAGIKNGWFGPIIQFMMS